MQMYHVFRQVDKYKLGKKVLQLSVNQMCAETSLLSKGVLLMVHLWLTYVIAIYIVIYLINGLN